MLGVIREIHPCVSDGESLVTPEMLRGTGAHAMSELGEIRY